MEENQEVEEKKVSENLKEKVEEKIKEIVEKNGIQATNIEYLYKLVDIHKDLENEEFWKKEEKEMNYRYEGMDDYSYGRRGVPGTGRYRDNYGRRGVPGSGRGRYRGEETIEDMRETYNDYTDGKEEYRRGNYGAKENTIESLDYMLKSVVQFFKMLEEDADTEEEMQLIKKYSRKISEM